MLIRKLGAPSVWTTTNRLIQFFELILVPISSIKIVSSNGWGLRQLAQFVADVFKAPKVTRTSREIMTATMETRVETQAIATYLLILDEMATVGVCGVGLRRGMDFGAFFCFVSLPHDQCIICVTLHLIHHVPVYTYFVFLDMAEFLCTLSCSLVLLHS